MRTCFRGFVLWFVFVSAVPAIAQVWDRSGNGMLNGTYYFREVIWLFTDAGDLGRAITAFGAISFDGQGRFTLSGTLRDTAQGAASYTASGTYSIGANGYGFLTHPVANNALVYGLVSGGVFIGSSTESGFNDLMMAVQESGATNASFQGSYSVSYLNYPTGGFEDNYGVLATLNPNGQGAIGSVPVQGYIASTGSEPFTRTIPAVTYSFSQGAGQITFPANDPVLGGQKFLFISPDGDLVFGGTPLGFDFFVGVRRGTNPPPPLSGLYYLAGLNQTLLDLTTGGDTDTYYGAFRAGGGTIVGHQRFLSIREETAQNYTYTDDYPSRATLEYFNEATRTEYVIGPDAKFRIGFGRGPLLGLSVALRAPAFSGEGVYIQPTGVVNGASSAPFTAGIARGELLTLYGANLSNADLLVAPSVPLPASLGGVQVMINNRPAPIYYVSRGQVAAIVPYGTIEGIAQVQVINNGTNSNAVTAFVYVSAPGIFSQSQDGSGYGAVLHADYKLVTPENPAIPGEVLQVYLTGLGDVFPTIQDGAAGPVSSLSTAQDVTAFIGAKPAEILYAGLAPTLPALYQVNVRVPDGTGPGDVYLDIAGAGARTSQVLIPIANTTADASARTAGEVPYRRR